jgi:hypothetical protein
MTLAFSGGMTAIARFKMTGNANSWERIFDFGKGGDNDNVMLTRQFESSKLEFLSVALFHFEDARETFLKSAFARSALVKSTFSKSRFNSLNNPRKLI